MKTTPNAAQKQGLADKLMGHRKAALDLLAKLTAHVEDHFGADPESCDWGNVGDAARLVDLLRQATDAAGIKGD